MLKTKKALKKEIEIRRAAQEDDAGIIRALAEENNNLQYTIRADSTEIGELSEQADHAWKIAQSLARAMVDSGVPFCTIYAAIQPLCDSEGFKLYDIATEITGVDVQTDTETGNDGHYDDMDGFALLNLLEGECFGASFDTGNNLREGRYLEFQYKLYSGAVIKLLNLQPNVTERKGA